MNLAALKTFVAIVDTGSLVRASEQLNVTQSTVTMRLKSLETALGQPLLTRNKSGVALTPPGTKLLGYARVITGLWRQAQFETGLPAGTSGICNFGCPPDFWPIGGQRLFDLIRRTHPDVALSVFSGSETELESWMQSGRIDICLTSEPLARKAQQVLPLSPDHLALYSDRRQTPIRSDSQYIFVDYGEGFRQRHSETYFDAGIARIVFNSPVIALNHLLREGGSAYLPRGLVEGHGGAADLFEIREAPVFELDRYLIVSEALLQSWDWLGQTTQEV